MLILAAMDIDGLNNRMQRLLSSTEKERICVGLYEMSTHLPRSQSLSRFLPSFGVGQISHQQHKGSPLHFGCCGHQRVKSFRDFPDCTCLLRLAFLRRGRHVRNLI